MAASEVSGGAGETLMRPMRLRCAKVKRGEFGTGGALRTVRPGAESPRPAQAERWTARDVPCEWRRQIVQLRHTPPQAHPECPHLFRPWLAPRATPVLPLRFRFAPHRPAMLPAPRQLVEAPARSPVPAGWTRATRKAPRLSLLVRRTHRPWRRAPPPSSDQVPALSAGAAEPLQSGPAPPRPARGSRALRPASHPVPWPAQTPLAPPRRSRIPAARLHNHCAARRFPEWLPALASVSIPALSACVRRLPLAGP